MTDTKSAKPDLGTPATALRETVKWLAASFSAIAALAIGTTPLTGLADMPLGWRSAAAALFLSTAVGCVARALWLTVGLLSPRAIYRSDLYRQTADVQLKQVQTHIGAHAKDLLPPQLPTLEVLGAQLDALDAQLSSIPLGRGLTVAENAMAQQRAAVSEALNDLLPVASYERLQNAVASAIPKLFAYGGAAFLSLVVFSLFTGGTKGKDKPATTIIQTQVLPDASPASAPITSLPLLAPVLFASGKNDISAEAMEPLRRARDELQRHPDAVLLIRAQTDTVASSRTNASLAVRRGQTVRQTLLTVGGVAADRLFVSDLPKSTLPKMTPDSTDEQENRVVRLQLVNVPALR